MSNTNLEANWRSKSPQEVALVEKLALGQLAEISPAIVLNDLTPYGQAQALEALTARKDILAIDDTSTDNGDNPLPDVMTKELFEAMLDQRATIFVVNGDVRTLFVEKSDPSQPKPYYPKLLQSEVLGPIQPAETKQIKDLDQKPLSELPRAMSFVSAKGLHEAYELLSDNASLERVDYAIDHTGKLITHEMTRGLIQATVENRQTLLVSGPYNHGIITILFAEKPSVT